MIAIVDYDVGNPGSVLNMIRRIGGDARLSSAPDEVRGAGKIILPGVGAFDAATEALRERGLDIAIRAAVDDGATVLGICLGMQLLLEGSEEGVSPGLSLVPGRCRRFDVADLGLRVPHMGWNTLDVTRPSILFDTGAAESRFYFVHSYHAECDDPADVTATTTYGHPFAAAFERGRVLGVQFHPEKSHRFGMALMKRFLEA